MERLKDNIRGRLTTELRSVESKKHEVAAERDKLNRVRVKLRAEDDRVAQQKETIARLMSAERGAKRSVEAGPEEKTALERQREHYVVSLAHAEGGLKVLSHSPCCALSAFDTLFCRMRRQQCSRHRMLQPRHRRGSKPWRVV